MQRARLRAYISGGFGRRTGRGADIDDCTISPITIDPEFAGGDFVVGKTGAKRTLSMRDGQHVNVFTEG